MATQFSSFNLKEKLVFDILHFIYSHPNGSAYSSPDCQSFGVLTSANLATCLSRICFGPGFIPLQEEPFFKSVLFHDYS